MTTPRKKIADVFASATLMVGTGAAVAVPFMADSANATPLSGIEQVSASSESALTKIANVQGQFSFGQDIVTPNSIIKSVFQAASQAVCNTESILSSHDVERWKIAVTNNGTDSYSVTVDDLNTSDQNQQRILGCACSANQAGGGAIVNVEVGGVSIADLYERSGK